MTDALFSQEAVVRFAAFLGVFLVLAGSEALWPARLLSESRLRRWPRNLLLLALDGLILRLAVPLLAIGVAVVAERNGFGLFNRLGWPGWVEIALALVALDLLLYFQHRLLHAWPLLWRLHRAHHSDRDLDVTSGGRFHPFEIVPSMLVKMAAVAALGVAPFAVLLFEILLNAASMFSHSNLRLPRRLDQGLRLVIVTPAMHRIHHSEDGGEQRSNFGFALSLWDRLFASYRDHPRRPDFVIGLSDRRDRRDLRLPSLLLDPLRKTP